AGVPGALDRQHALECDAAAVHLVIELDHRRTVEMPGQAVARRAALDQLVGEERMDVAHGVELHRAGVAPARADRRHAALHLAEYPARLLAQARRARVAARDDVVAIVRLAL